MKQYKYILLSVIQVVALFSYAESDNLAKKIDLSDNWRFAIENNDEGLKNAWYSIQHNDDPWIEIQAGKGWNEQGISHSGFGWYRKTVFIPLEYKDMPMTLFLGKISYDDDAYFNGERIGGLHGPYKYKNLLDREYPVPSRLIKYGEENLIAVRVWGMLGKGNEGSKFGLAQGPFFAKFDPLSVVLRRGNVEYDPRSFDITDGQHNNLSFEIICKTKKPELNKTLNKTTYYLTDYYDNELAQGEASYSESTNGIVKVIVRVDNAVAHKIYFSGRFKLNLKGIDSSNAVLFETTQHIDRLTYNSRDNLILGDIYNNVIHDTPYGKLRLIDEIDCSMDVTKDEHPYMQSGFDPRHQYQTPGSPVKVEINEIFGKKVRESDNGWFAYRIGRGKLNAGSMYLLRVEYPEDKPRYCPIEIQTGENYMDIGWRTGISTDNPYDNWPLSGKYQWFDVIIPLDKTTTGTSGANGADSKRGFWVYFMNKRNYPGYYPLFEGGPAISTIRLYEIDIEESKLAVNRPKDLPERILMCDWERQALINPDGIVQYCKLMGYNAVSPVIMKWHDMNYGDPLTGYNSYNVDERGYWNMLDVDSGKEAKEAIPGKTSVHHNFLEATKKQGIGYIPRVEYGGSLNLPVKAHAIASDGYPAKPSRFFSWSGNLLDSAVYDDFKVLLDFLVQRNIQDYPQLKGVLWRIRCDRMPISYGQDDIALFVRENNVILPTGLSSVELANWASTGNIGAQYADWWHKKRADFHARLGKLMQRYRPDLKMYYYNWDNDKFSLGMPDLTGWDFLAPAAEIAKTHPDSALNLYVENIEKRKNFTGTDYVQMIESGKLGIRQCTQPHHGLRPYLYKDISGFELFAPANSLYLADNKDYLTYFNTKEGVAVSNSVPYDESFGRFINHKYEGNETVPGGPAFSMALELMSYFHTDANTLSFTTYTYGRGFAEAHRRFAQAYLALPAIQGTDLLSGDDNVKIRRYDSEHGIYIGVASKAYQNKTIKIKLKNLPDKYAKVIDLVSGELIPAVKSKNTIQFEINSGAMELNSFLVK